MRLGQYEVLEELGRGASGRVHRGRARDGQEVALKLLTARHPGAAERFLREARLQGSFGPGEGFVPLLDAGEDAQGRPYLVLPLLEGGSLADRLSRGRLGVERARELGLELARALGVAHGRGVVHRDVKPQNVLFDQQGRALLSDLGLARHFAGAGTGLESVGSRTGELRGTLGYMAPEQLLDAKHVGPPADVFALGAVLYEALTGRPAFAGPSLVELSLQTEQGRFTPVRKLVPEVPTWLAAVVERALSPQPERRFADGAALARALEGRQVGQVGQAGPRATDAVRAAARARAALAALVLLAGLLGAATIVLKRRQAAAGGDGALPEPSADALTAGGLPPELVPAWTAAGAPPMRVYGAYEGMFPTPIQQIVPLPGRDEVALVGRVSWGEVPPQPGPWLCRTDGAVRATLDHLEASHVAVSRDGRRLISASRDELRLWDPARAALLKTNPLTGMRVVGLALTDQGDLAVWATVTRTELGGGRSEENVHLQVWDVERGQVQHVATLPERELESLTVLAAPPDLPPRVAIVGSSGRFRTLELPSGRVVAEAQTRDDDQRFLPHFAHAVDPGSGWLVVSWEQPLTDEGTLSWWDLNSGGLRRRARRPGESRAVGLALRPGSEGEDLVLADADGKLHQLIGTGQWREVGQARLCSTWLPMAWQGRRLLIGERRLRAVDPQDPRSGTGAPTPAHQHPVVQLALTPDGERIVSLDEQELIEWDARDGAPRHRQLLQSAKSIRGLCLTNNGTRVLADRGDAIRQWVRRAGEWSDEPLVSLPDGAGGAVLHANRAGDVVLAHLSGGLWRVEEGRLGLLLSDLGNGELSTVFLAPDGSAVMLGRRAGRHELWDPRRGTRLAELQGWPRATWLTNPPWRAICLDPEAVSVREVPGGRELGRLPLTPDMASLSGAIVSPGGAWVALGTLTGKLALWRPGEPAARWTLDMGACQDWASGLAFSEDDRVLLVGTSRGLVLRFDLSPSSSAPR